MWGCGVFDWCESLASETHSGGIIAIWDPSIFCASQRFISERWIMLEGCMVKSNFNCCVGIVYGPNDRQGRSQIFDAVKAVCQSINKPVLLLGDFNEVFHPSEHIGQFRCDRSITEFVDWVNDLHLIDIPLQGMRFTWGRLDSQSKLDRCLCENDWLLKFLRLKLEGLKRSFSDHNPLLLSLEKIENWGPKPFRCFDVWFSNPEFKSFVHKEWEDLPNLNLVNKMKALKEPIKSWSKEKFGEIDNYISRLENALHDLQKLGS